MVMIDMDMPRSCSCCTMALKSRVHKQMFYCAINEKYYPIYNSTYGRQTKCPLIEVKDDARRSD